MKTKVYSWRLSSGLKSELERQARLRKVSISTIIDTAVRDWLKKSAIEASDDEAQRKLHAAAEKCFGVLSGITPGRAENVRDTVRRRVRERIARSQKESRFLVSLGMIPSLHRPQ